MRPFVHLHVHSQYSILDGQASIPALVDKAIADGMSGIALTDHGAMFGIKEFYNYVAKKNSSKKSEIKSVEKEIKALQESSQQDNSNEALLQQLQDQLVALKKQLFVPILGCEAYCARRSRFNKDPRTYDPYHPKRSIDASGWHLILLAKNLQGYKNLIKMISLGWTEGEYYHPRIDKELLQKYHEGIIVCSACLGGEVAQHIMAGFNERARDTINWFKGVFGDDYYLEIQLHRTDNPLADREIYPKQKIVADTIMQLAQETGVKVIATNDTHFVNEEDAEAHDRLICLSTGRALDDPSRMRYSKQEWVKTQEEMNAVFADYPDVLENTLEILNKIEFYSIDSDPLMPDFPIPKEFENADDYLRHLTYLGAERNYGDDLNDEIRERLDFELNIIKTMGFPGYFLIVQDFIGAARGMGVSVGPGRGSAAGSAVAYCLGITNIDPIKYDLLFERFLNPDRISMPDIDIDFDDDGRAEILRWVTEKYGEERVAHIITYGTMASKSAIKDVARVEDLPLPESNRLAKLIPDRIPDVKKVTLEEAIKYDKELQQATVSTDPKVRNTLKYARQLEGNVRNTGVHACGIIIGKADINTVVPVSTATDSRTGERLLVTQYEGSVIEETGLIKMDFLGLKTLSIIKEAIEYIEKRHGKRLDIDRIPLDDPATYNLYCEGKTVGTFQFESLGMQKYLRELKPSSFEDLIAMNALYRPGPMEKIPSFIRRKHGLEVIEYDIPQMERYLKDTYGITIYQEQVMLLSRELAGFTRGESDTLRKAMGKKQIEKMNQLRDKFLKQGTEKGHSKSVLEKIWREWEEFAKYAFNKSHATCYSWVAYQTAYLKANFPAEYMAGALSRNLSNASEISKLMDECRSLKIGVLTPDVNESTRKFSVNKEGNIRFGLSAIKGVGVSAVDAIIRERESNGMFVDVFDFVERVDLKQCNRKAMESFVLSGALDSFGFPREVYFAPMSERPDETFLQALLRYGTVVQQEKREVTNNLFFGQEEVEIPHPVVPKTELWSDLIRLNKERELVGLYLSANPLEEYRLILEHFCNTNTQELNDLEKIRGKGVIFCGIVTETFQGITRKNTPFARITLEDTMGTTTIPLFGNNFVNYGNYCKKGLYLLVRGSIQSKPWNEEDLELNISSIDLLPEVADKLIKNVQVSVPIAYITQDFITELKQSVEQNPGDVRMNIEITDNVGDVKVNFSGITITPGTWICNCLDKYAKTGNELSVEVDEMVANTSEEEYNYPSTQTGVTELGITYQIK